MKLNNESLVSRVESKLSHNFIGDASFVNPSTYSYANGYIKDAVEKNIDHVKQCLTGTLKKNNGINIVQLAANQVTFADGDKVKKSSSPLAEMHYHYLTACQNVIDHSELNYDNVELAQKHRELKAKLKDEAKLANEGVLTVGALNFMIDSPARQFGSSEVNQVAISRFVPERDVPSMTIQNVIFDPIRGMMQSRQPGQEFLPVNLLGTKSQTMSPFWFGEYTRIDETYMFMRDQGSMNIASLFLEPFMRFNQLLLMTRAKHREFDLTYQALCTGQYQQNDGLTLSLATTWAINTQGQQYIPVTQNWAVATGDANSPFAMNPLANPPLDIINAIYNYKPWDKYRALFLETGCMVMNPNTYNMFITNPNTQSTIAYQMAQSNGFNQFDMDAFFKFFIPGAGNIKILVDATVRMNEDFTTQYVMPDGYILFPFSPAGMSDGYAQLVRTLNSQIGGLFNPQPGLFTAIVDQSSLNSVFGMQGNPQIRNYIGENMNIRLPNPFQNLSFKVF